MPYRLGEQGSHGCDGWPVIDAETGRVTDGGCHPTREQALAHQRALTINVADEATASKSVEVDGWLSVAKAEEPQRRVFGWASVAASADGDVLVDQEGDIIPIDVLEEAAYGWVAEFRHGGQDHDDAPPRGHAIESMVFTAEKQRAMGIPEGTVPEAWWIGLEFTDDDAFASVVKGERPMFSIHGTALVETLTDGEGGEDG